MNFKSSPAIAAAILVTASMAAQADTFVTDENRSITSKRGLVATCVKSIKKHHGKWARLFLNRQGQLKRIDDELVYSIQGWVWKNGERMPVFHDCVNRNEGGLAVTVSFASEQVADAVTKEAPAS